MLNKLLQLNENFFELYGNIRENTENLSPKQLAFMQDKLFEQYKIEYTKIALEKEIEDKSIKTTLKMRYGGYVPFKFLWFRNTAFNLLDKQISKELDEFFVEEFNGIGFVYPEVKPKKEFKLFSKIKAFLKRIFKRKPKTVTTNVESEKSTLQLKLK